jgi:hypothetical protein
MDAQPFNANSTTKLIPDSLSFMMISVLAAAAQRGIRMAPTCTGTVPARPGPTP